MAIRTKSSEPAHVRNDPTAHESEQNNVATAHRAQTFSTQYVGRHRNRRRCRLALRGQGVGRWRAAAEEEYRQTPRSRGCPTVNALQSAQSRANWRRRWAFTAGRRRRRALYQIHKLDDERQPNGVMRSCCQAAFQPCCWKTRPSITGCSAPSATVSTMMACTSRWRTNTPISTRFRSSIPAAILDQANQQHPHRHERPLGQDGAPHRRTLQQQEKPAFRGSQ